MDLKEASLTMCHLLLHEKRVHEEYEARKKAGVAAIPDEHWLPHDIEAVYQEKLHDARINIAEFGNRLASMPAFFDIMESWLVTIIGRQGVSKETMEEAAATNDRDDMIERIGALATSVRDYLRSQGFILRDMGAGEDGWDMCVRCTENKSRTLCTDFHQRYMSAIQMKLISVSRRFGGHYLPGLYTWRDAQRLLRAFGDAQNNQEDQDD